MTLSLRYAVRSDPGLVRENNQDSVYAGPRLLAVADGMGGMAAGDLASSVVISALSRLDQDVPNEAMIDALDDAVQEANRELHDGVEANPALRGMGTTLTALLFSVRTVAMVHIGDSRAYLLRDGNVRQVTKDHTYVQMLLDEGAISVEEASQHPHRSLVTQVLQGQPIEPSYSVRAAVEGDRYLLCSDGLSNVVSLETIAEVLRVQLDPNECTERLIELALHAGGPDNITAVVADVVEGEAREGEAVVYRATSIDPASAAAAVRQVNRSARPRPTPRATARRTRRVTPVTTPNEAKSAATGATTVTASASDTSAEAPVSAPQRAGTAAEATDASADSMPDPSAAPAAVATPSGLLRRRWWVALIVLAILVIAGYAVSYALR